MILTGGVAAPPVVEPAETWPPPGLVPPERTGLRLSWTAPWLGRTWELSDCDAPVYRVLGPVSNGLTDPSHQWLTAAKINGSLWQDHRVDVARETHLVGIETTTTAEFAVEHAAVMAWADPTREGLLRWTRPDGTWRELACRYESGLGLSSWEGDPFEQCRALYPVTWVAADPFWAGPPMVLSFPYEVASSFFPGPPFTFAAASSLNSSQVDNPGDVPSYALWRVTGPFSSFTVGVGDALVQMAVSKAAGQWVEIDMRPGVYTMLDETGADMWDFQSEAAFEPIPPGVSDLTTSVSGSNLGPTSGVTLSFTPRYRSAF